MANTLDFTKESSLDPGTLIYQLDQGTIFYWKDTLPKKLYVKWKGNELSAQLPAGIVHCKGAFGNAVYLSTDQKIYKAEFSISDGIKVSFLREKIEGEIMECGGLCTQVHDGMKYVYRMQTDPYRDNILVHLSDQEMKGLELRFMHRGKAVYFTRKDDVTSPSFSLSKNVIIFAARNEYSLYGGESSHFIYLASGNSVHIFDTVSMEFLHTFRAENIKIQSIAGVRNGVITVNAVQGNEVVLMNASMPKENFENSITVFGETMPIEILVQRYKEMDIHLREYLEKGIETDHKKIELQSTIAELQKKNATLREEKKMIERIDEDMMTELKMSIKVLESRNFDLSEKMKGKYQVYEDEKRKLNRIIAEQQEKNAELTKDNLEKSSALRIHNYKVEQENLKFKQEIELENASKETELATIIAKLRTDLAESTQENLKIQSEYDECSDELDVDGFIIELRKQIAESTENNVKEESGKVSELHTQINKLNLEKIRIQQDFDDCKDEMRKMENELRKKFLEEKCEKEKELESTITKLRTEVDELTQENLRIQQECEEFNEELDTANADLLDKQAELTQEKNINRRINEEIQELKRSIIGLEQKNDQSSQEIKRKSMEENSNQLMNKLTNIISEPRQENPRVHSEVEEIEEEDDKDMIKEIIAQHTQEETVEETRKRFNTTSVPIAAPRNSKAIVSSEECLDATSPVPIDPGTNLFNTVLSSV